MKSKIFYGPAMSGKTKLAHMITDLYPEGTVLWLNGQGSSLKIYKELMKVITPQTRLVVIDDIRKSFNYECLFGIIPRSQMGIIITTNFSPKDKSLSFTERFDIVEFP